MQIFNSIQEFRDRKNLSQFFSKTGLVISRGVYHEGLAFVVKKMVAESDCRILLVCPNVDEDYMKWKKDFNIDAFSEVVRSFNLDYLVIADFDEFNLYKDSNFEVKGSQAWFNDKLAIFYLRVLSIFKPKFLYIGQKDFIEAKMILSLIHDFCFATELNVVENFRSKEGITSAANLSKLSDDSLGQIQVLHRSLEFIQRMIQNGQTDTLKLTTLVYEFVVSFKEFKLLRLLFLDAYNLSEVRFIDNSKKILIQIEGEIESLPFVDNVII